MASLRQQLLDLVEKLVPDMERAFLKAIGDVKSEIVLREVVERLERRDIEGAIAALHIDASAFRPLTEALRQAFNQGGALVVENIPRLADPLGGRVVFRWDVGNQRAEANIRALSSDLITNVTEGTKQAARQAIVAGYAQGQGPRAIALDLVGKTSPVTQQREGGIIGLSEPQADLIARNRINLLSGDPKLMAKYLDLKTRDKRLDGAVKRAMAAGKPVSASDLDKILMRLRDRNLKLRGEMIARTETTTSVMAAKHEAYQQGLDIAGRDASLVTRKWRSAGDSRVRHTHMILNAQEVTGMDTPFQSPSGALMRFPGDTSMGAGASEIIGCRCDVEYKFNFAEAYARSRGR
ncbi:phage head morphogenesis protein [Allorhizobium sp. BGMRC 0089]|uniref:phage minor head protein n=1 Tax=Allorhizobium sonneratiae TaxID=2934936 RepID=UPI002033753F|nr:phage minor head protein [Allorhizobium sonneratiae]MCM2293036.1 phage head morphogenesis protein [Allorhizobium sonneratiae]